MFLKKIVLLVFFPLFVSPNIYGQTLQWRIPIDGKYRCGPDSYDMIVEDNGSMKIHQESVIHIMWINSASQSLYYGSDSDRNGLLDADEQYDVPYVPMNAGTGNMLILDFTSIPNGYYILFGTIVDGDTYLTVQKDDYRLMFPMNYMGSWK